MCTVLGFEIRGAVHPNGAIACRTSEKWFFRLLVVGRARPSPRASTGVLGLRPPDSQDVVTWSLRSLLDFSEGSVWAALVISVPVQGAISAVTFPRSESGRPMIHAKPNKTNWEAAPNVFTRKAFTLETQLGPSSRLSLKVLQNNLCRAGW